MEICFSQRLKLRSPRSSFWSSRFHPEASSPESEAMILVCTHFTSSSDVLSVGRGGEKVGNSIFHIRTPPV